jgi:hypothetical protein
MSRDLLDEATSALRDTTEPEEGGASFTRARVMASLHQGRVRRRTRMAFLLPIAATLAAASAFGVGSESGRAMVREVGVRFGLLEPPPKAAPPEPAPDKKPARRVGPAPAPAEDKPTPPVEIESEAPSEPPPPEPTAPSAAAINAAEERELSLYRTAHRAHFVQRDFSAALAGWSDYLREVPGGRFTLEARYNRALCLVQLGRQGEARSALEPFARGRFGTYRQHEAQELLDALGQ